MASTVVFPEQGNVRGININLPEIVPTRSPSTTTLSSKSGTSFFNNLDSYNYLPNMDRKERKQSDSCLPTLHPELNDYKPDLHVLVPGEFTLRVTKDVKEGLGAHMDRMKREKSAHDIRLDSLNKSIQQFDEIIQNHKKVKNSARAQKSLTNTMGSGELNMTASTKRLGLGHSKGFVDRPKMDKDGFQPSPKQRDALFQSYEYLENTNSDDIVLKKSRRKPVTNYTELSKTFKSSKQEIDDILRNRKKARSRRNCSIVGFGVKYLNPTGYAKTNVGCRIGFENDTRRGSLMDIGELERYYETPTVRFIRIGQARSLFIKTIKRIIALLYWWAAFSSRYGSIELKLKTFHDMAEEFEAQTSQSKRHVEVLSGTKFDPREYKASRELNITKEVQFILSTRPSQRTQQQIQKVVHGLQCLKSYAEYPIHMQMKIAKVACYQEVSPKRIILRQGHRPEFFYFVLAGKAAVKVITQEEGKISVSIVAKLSKGQCFGEIALLHNSVRTATVESATQMVLLTVYKDDFLEIFFNMKNGEDPEHVTFCREIPFLQNWPINELAGDPSSCVFHYFRRGSVVVPDSQDNDWIYIVKSGSCRVLKRLKSVDAYRSWKYERPSTGLEYKNNLGSSADADSRIDSGIYRKTALAVPNTVGRSMTEFFTTNLNTDLAGDFHPELKVPEVISFQIDHVNEEGEVEQGEHVAPITITNKSGSCGNSVSNVEKEHSNEKVKQQKNTESTHTPGMSKSTYASFMSNVKFQKCSLPLIKEHASDSNSSTYIHSRKPASPCYITLRKLRPKDIFGLEEVQFEDEQYDKPDVSVILVSDGSELVMISKKKFLDHANEFVRQYVREHVQFYPPDDILQRSLQTEVNWDLYKTEVMTDTMQHMEDIKHSAR